MQIPAVPPFVDSRPEGADASKKAPSKRSIVNLKDLPGDDDIPQFGADPSLEDQFSKLRATHSSSGESAPSLPSAWSAKSPSLPESASDLVAEKLSKKSEQLEKVNARLDQYKAKVKALSAELKASRKRRRAGGSDTDKSVGPDNSDTSPEATPPPPKKTSPETKSPAKTPKPRPAKAKADPPAASSEDEPPSPIKSSSPAPRKPPSYAGLNSVVCAFREGGFVPGEDGMSFELCAELVTDEINDIKTWTKKQRAEHYGMIFSAFELVYPGKAKKWRQLPFAKSNSATVNYWVKVLNKWKNIWLKKAAALASKPANQRSPTMDALTKRIRDKLASKTALKVKEVSAPKPRTTGSKASSAKRPIVISGSDSGEEPVEVEDEDTEDKPAVAKLADPPESYSRAEMKAFAKAARAIRNVPSDKAHTPATADFIDAEFSDHSGRAARILRSPFSWKRQKFKEIASKAARITEERSCNHACRPPNLPNAH